MNRIDGRRVDQLRETRIIPGYQSFAEGSALIEMGQTKVICSASIEERVPPWLRGQGRGWVTAEYSMLPRSTLTRNSRESATGRVKGRHQEIQRLIGRALRPVTDLTGLGERMVVVDCDVLQADGGTRHRRHHRRLRGPLPSLPPAPQERRLQANSPARLRCRRPASALLTRAFSSTSATRKTTAPDVDFNIAHDRRRQSGGDSSFCGG